MCGRISRTSPREVLAEEFCVSRFVNVDLRARYNVAPSRNLETIIRGGDEKRMGPMRWGFVSPTAKDSKLAPINARAENVATSQMFREIDVAPPPAETRRLAAITFTQSFTTRGFSSFGGIVTKSFGPAMSRSGSND